MIHDHTIKPQPWMKAPETVRLMACLSPNDTQPQALFVGGCVRNAVLNKHSDDIDIATTLTPEETIKTLKKDGIKVVPTGLAHGTVTAIIGDKKFEITTLRKDIETDGRHARVEHTDSWTEDAGRRDFTINTLLMNIKGRVYDPLGRGLQDLKDRRIIFVGDPARRIAEDHLRILRFFRFHAYYGIGAPDQNALNACTQAAGTLSSLSKERTTQEMFKLLSAQNPAPILKLMAAHNILSAVTALPGTDHHALEHLCRVQDTHNVNALTPRLFVLCRQDTARIPVLEEHVIVTNALKKRMHALAGAIRILKNPAHIQDQDAADLHQIKHALYRQGRDATIQALCLTRAESDLSALLRAAQNEDIPVFPVKGSDLIAQGIKPGPALGTKLKALEEAWITNNFRLPSTPP